MSVKCSIIYKLLLVFSFSLLGYHAFVLATDHFSSLQHSRSLCHEHERFALIRFKQTFRFDCSHSFSNHPYPKVKSWHELDHHVPNGTVTSDCCRWDGVKCDKETGHVIGLDLSSSCLFGTFPQNSTLFDLDHLSELNLADNHFNYSEIPVAIGHMYKLTYLNLSESTFSGQIPSEISNLYRLSVLDLSNNGDPFLVNHPFGLKLHDPSLEMLVSNLTRLTQLALDSVDISSTVPLILSNRTSLELISMEFCYLFGEFPKNIYLLPNIEAVMLSMNPSLRGYLPEFHSDSPLTYIELMGTMFSGELPTSLGNLHFLTDLQLQDCEISGQIPFSIGNLTKVTTLLLDGNFLSGSFPTSLTNLTRLRELGLSDVKISDHRILNSWFPKLNKLTSITLSDMNLGNEILPALENFTRLIDLVLNQNQLTCQLPHWFMNLTELVTLDLSSNQLQGPVPSWISNLSNLESIKLSFKNSVGMLNPFLQLPYLSDLCLSGVSLKFPSHISTNSSILIFDILKFESCNLKEFPEFLRHQDKLQVLSLSGNNITGNIPQWFVNITRNSLMSLDLSNNLLTGFEEPPMFLPWNNLETLNFNGNKFRGSLLSPPRSMQIYKVSNNAFSGVIPKNICDATSLIYLDLSGNNLSSQIPSCIVHKLGSTLQILNLRGNIFSGIIPHMFSMSCALRMINLNQNQLEGKLPRSIGNCLELEVLDVGRNHINDSFPKWLGSLPKLQVLVLRHNNFHGKITSPLHGYHFQNLRIIDISYNFHTGNLPSSYIRYWLAMAVSVEDSTNSSNSFLRLSIVSPEFIEFDDEPYNYVITITNKGVETAYSRILTVLRVIDFSSNQFTGRIPEVIGDLRGLQALNLSNNNLGGRIPSSMFNITDLEALDLSQNRLSGEIPQDLTVLTSLEVFNVSHNRLVGPIPQGNQFNTFDASSFEGNLALCGAQLSIKCDNTSVLPPSPSEELSNSSKDEMIGWIIKLLGCASGFIIGYVISKIYVTNRHHDWFIETFGRRGRFETTVRRLAPRRSLRN